MPLDYRALRVGNFKSLRDVRVELGKLNVVGPNGSGKSALLEALLFAREVARPRGSPPYPFARWWGYANVVHMRDASRNVEFAVEGSAPNGVPFQYRFVVNGAGDALRILVPHYDDAVVVGEPLPELHAHVPPHVLQMLVGPGQSDPGPEPAVRWEPLPR